MSKSIKAQVTQRLPYVVGAMLVMMFFALCAWQISRGLEKAGAREAFETQSGFSSWSDGMAVNAFQKLRTTGQFDNERQVLLENIIVNSQVGFYVLTPLRVDAAAPLLLVNRGWIAGNGSKPDPAKIGVSETRLTVHGRVGSVPRAGYRMGEPISTASGWPKLAVYPTLDELALTLGEPVQPFVLLMDPEDEFGFLRQWTPEQMGPGRHYAYALQWLAMGIVLAGLLIWNYRKRGFAT